MLGTTLRFVLTRHSCCSGGTHSFVIDPAPEGGYFRECYLRRHVPKRMSAAMLKANTAEGATHVINREHWLGTTLVELADFLTSQIDEAEYAHGVAERLAELLSSAEIGVLIAGESGQLTPVAASTPGARDLSLLEAHNGTGPCTRSYRTGQPLLNQSMEALAVTWPEFAAVGRDAGVTHVSALPMRRRHQTIGAIGVLEAGPAQLTAADAGLAQTVVEAATVSILQQRALRDSARKCEQLQSALDSRVVIEQAKGAVAARLSITPEAAFELLRSYARRHNRTLVDVAGETLRGDFRKSL